MQAGALDRQVTFRRATTAPNAFNEPEETWADVATVWASKADVSDGERTRAAQVGAMVTTRFQVRYNAITSDLSNRDQLVCEGRTYQITAIKELGRRVGLEITAAAQADTPPAP